MLALKAKHLVKHIDLIHTVRIWTVYNTLVLSASAAFCSNCHRHICLIEHDVDNDRRVLIVDGQLSSKAKKEVSNAKIKSAQFVRQMGTVTSHL